MSRPSILVVTYISPLQKWGSAHRSRLLIDALSRHGHVDVLSLSFGAAAADHGQATQTPLGTARVIDMQIANKGLSGRPRFDITSRDITREVGKQIDLSSYDLIVSRYIRPAMKLALPPNVPVIVDFDDALYEPPWSALQGLKPWVGAFLRLFNDRVIVRARLRLHKHQHYFFCRQAEREIFPALPSSVLPNSPPRPKRVGPPDFTPPATPALMFIGLLDYVPNEDAVDWFLASVWPTVLKGVPSARLLLAGTVADERRQRWSQFENVDVLGFVDDLAQTYARATASIVPMRSGAGTNVKALEPLLYGRPVIATPLVVSGYRSLVNLSDVVLIADDPAEFAQHCIGLLQHPDRASDLARRGYERINAELDVPMFNAIVDAAVNKVLATSSPSTTPNVANEST
jgi:glycosyltransferase involved in cell wall biosynthesis